MSSPESPLWFLLLAGRPENVSSLKELVIFLENLLWLFTVTNHKLGGGKESYTQGGTSHQLVRAP